MSQQRKRRGRVFVWFERVSLGVGMSVMAFFIERRLISAIKKGGMKTRPPEEPETPERNVELAASANQVGDQPDR
jgi:hypothetical protein